MKNRWWSKCKFLVRQFVHKMKVLATMLGVMDTSLIDTSLKVSHVIISSKEWDIPRLQNLVDEPHL